MLENFLKTICSELSIPSWKEVERGRAFALPFAEGIDVTLTDLEPGVAMKALISPCPKGKREDLFIHLMRANLLGQGTGGARLGLEESEKHLTLSIGLPYEMNYQTFKEQLEGFVNHLLYWRQTLVELESPRYHTP